MNLTVTMIAQAITFFVFIFFCKKFVWPPLVKAIESRQKEIADGLAAAERGKQMNVEMLSLEDIQEILRVPLIGVVPESEAVLHASNQGIPAVHMEGSDVAQAYRDVVARFLGEQQPMRFTSYQKPGLLKRMFGAR